MQERQAGKDERTLTVCCRWGLVNRMRVLISGLALAEATGREFTMLWPRHFHCAAAFQELFTNDFNVIEDDLPANTPVYGLFVGGPRWPDLLRGTEPHLVATSGAWLIRPELYPGHKELMERCAELFETLEPVPYVRDQVAEFRAAHFRPTMIGVHLRRGDFPYAEVRENTAQAMARTDEFLVGHAEAGILLCTDDGAVHPATGRPTRTEGVKALFRRRYGERVVFTEPRSLDRRLPETAQDALIDFLLLRATDYIVGTKLSSFSRMAMFGRTTPLVMTVSSGNSYRAKRALLVVTGVYPLIKFLGYLQYRRNVPFSQLTHHYRWTARLAMARLRARLGR